MNENTKLVLERVSGWILPGLGLLSLAGVTLGGAILSMFGFLGLLIGGYDGFCGFSFLLGFVVTMLGLVLTAQRFFLMQKSDEGVKAD